MGRNKENSQLCEDARKIQTILAKGYSIKVWPNAQGKNNYYLVPDGKNPWEGAYIWRVDD